ncbi:YidC/Oxa1 family membrane protein insertase [Patescibacteria group bacterium]|nr:MAG: YidC/Oxa1 family membrane protein insertase [Patescibacteria group bacterium]
MASLFHNFVYQPIYNTLAALVSAVPGGDVGLAIIAITLIVRLILFPLSMSAIKTQIAMRGIEPLLKSLRVQYKDNKEELARKTMALFKDNKINPFASFFFILLQFPVIIGLYLVLTAETKLTTFDPALLYSFVEVPQHVSLMFLGFLDLTGKSIVLAGIVAITQFLYSRLIILPTPEKSADGKTTFQEDFAKSMSLQMKYVFPILLGIIAYVTSAAIALYFVVSNLFSIGQELAVRRMHQKENGKR